MSYEFYITPEEYAQASQNGVSASTLDKRIRLLAWTKERAVNTPPQKRRNLGEWAKIAKQNGIGRITFYSRINHHGWDIERAATDPLQDRKARLDRIRERRRVIPQDFVELAKQNGINYHTFRDRVAKSGWSLEKAATAPVMTRSEIGRLGRGSRGKISSGKDQWNCIYARRGQCEHPSER